MRKPAAPAPEESKRTFTALPLAQLVPGIARPVFRKRSPAGATVLADWAAIVGPRLAAQTEPRKLSRGTLTLACAGPLALELQHAAEMLIERINIHCGTQAVQRLRLVHDHVAPRLPPARPRPAQAPEPLAELPAGPLNDALASLAVALRNRKDR